MLLAMLPLALGAILSGMMLSGMGHPSWWNGSLAIHEAHAALESAHHAPLFIKLLPLLVAGGGALLAFSLFLKHRNKAAQLAQLFAIPYTISLNKWYVDELYDALWVRPTARLARVLSRVADALLIDGTVNTTARTVWDFGLSLRSTQTGYVYHYGFVMLMALATTLAYLLWGTV
jgi:NADH-quinone oxidoreductase subunit L